jgi:hypothetical protein
MKLLFTGLFALICWIVPAAAEDHFGVACEEKGNVWVEFGSHCPGGADGEATSICCGEDSQCWLELGNVCHADPVLRRKPDLRAPAATRPKP